MENDSIPTMRELMAAQDRLLQKRRESTDPTVVEQMAEYDAAMAANVRRLADHIDAQVLADMREMFKDRAATDDELRTSASRMIERHRASLVKLGLLKEREC